MERQVFALSRAAWEVTLEFDSPAGTKYSM